MLAKAGELGCPNLANGQPNGACLCQNANFGYGIRDCTAESCPQADQGAVISYGLSYCKASKLSSLLPKLLKLTANPVASSW